MSRQNDDETGLVYYGHRYYSPGLGRWVSRDPIEEGGGKNVFGFVGNRPVGAKDILGLAWTISRDHQYEWAVATPTASGDTFLTLAKEVKLPFAQRTKWLRNGSPGLGPGITFVTNTDKPKIGCKYGVPNTVLITYGKLDNGPYLEALDRTKEIQEEYENLGYHVDNHRPEGRGTGGDLITEIKAGLGKEQYAVWAHIGHGDSGDLLIRDGDENDILWAYDEYTPESLGAAKAHSFERVILFSCKAGLKAREWKNSMVSDDGILTGSPTNVNVISDRPNRVPFQDY